MSLTDDTNLQTIDIPLPDETIHNSGSSGESSATNSWTQSPTDVKSDQNVVNCHVVDQSSANNSTTYANQYANPYAANAVHPYYYPFYPSYQQMPQMMAQSYPYFMPPIIRPILPIVPQMSSMAAQKTTTANTNKANNSKDPKTTDDYYDDDDEEEDSDSDPTVARKSTKASNILPIHCTETMGLNPLIYQNIQSSPYFKNNLFQLKTYHEVIDEIFYSVKHLEPWEKGSRKVGGQTGMCGSVRGVGAGGIISTPFCILYKLFTLKLTRKQVNGLIRHKDSPFIRALGFMYVRFTQPPQHLYNWFEPFLEDEEELDPKAGGGAPMTVGQMCRHMLTKLDWFSTLFPRVPVPIQKQIEKQLKQRDEEYEQQMREERGIEDGEVEEEEEEQEEELPNRRGRDSSRDGYHKRTDRRHDRERKRSRSRDRRSRSRDDKSSRSDDRHRRRSRSPNSPHSHRHRGGDSRSDKSERNEHRHRRR